MHGFIVGYSLDMGMKGIRLHYIYNYKIDTTDIQGREVVYMFANVLYVLRI